jgi:PAS domain S-box-containing protein
MDSNLNTRRCGAEGKFRDPAPAAERPRLDPTPERPSSRGTWQQARSAGVPMVPADKTLSAMFQAVPDPLFLLDRDGNILACNEAAAQQLGRQAQELIGLSLPECLATAAPAAGHAPYATRIAEVLRSAVPVRFTEERGQLVWDQAICPVADSDGTVTGAVVSIHDITEQRRIEKQLSAYRESVRDTERLASLGMISATLTHELIQPLSVVQLAVQNAATELEKSGGPDLVRQDLQNGLTACAAISNIVNRFRHTARPPGKAREVEVRIAHVAEKTFRLLEQSAKQARMTLWAENLDTLPVLRMRENDLEQVFFALCQNAVQAADGAKERHLIVTGSLQENTIRLQFQDSCGGIDPAHLPRVFEPFFTTKPAGRGTGLGLCIARRIVSHRGGHIAVHNQPPEGVTFIVTLPRERGRATCGRYVR